MNAEGEIEPLLAPESGQKMWCLWWERGAATKRKPLDLVRWIVRDEGEREGAPFPPPPRGWTREWQRIWMWYLGGPEKRGGNDKEPLDLVRWIDLIATRMTIEQGWLCEEAEGV